MQGKGQFIISIDYEFELGFADYSLNESEKRLIQEEILITKQLLALFKRYTIPVTWAIVGHLLEKSCTWEGAVVHPEYKRPIRKGEKEDWFLHHPPKGEYADTSWFDSEKLITDISNSIVGHEIASHSYAHVIYGNGGITKENVEMDLKNMERVHSGANLPVTSFVFPRNKEAYHNLLKQYGILCYRGAPARWYNYFPGILRRAFHLFDYFLPFTRTTTVRIGSAGLINIPESMFLIGRWGFRKIIPQWFMEWKLKRGLKGAIKRQEIFHLWFHPSNFWHDREVQFRILENLLQEADRLRKEGKLHIVTMREVAKKYTKQHKISH